MSLLAAGLAIALPMAACIALAQEPAATSSKMTTPEGYSAHHSVDVSGRVSNAAGSGAMYDTLVNLQSGPRVSGETLELHKLDSNKHAWVDDARATGSGFGGDPYNFAKLSMSKAKLYEFSGIFRRDRQYFDYDLLGNPNIPGGLTLPIGPSTAPTGHLLWPQPQHSSVMTNSVRRMTDTDLTLFPLSTVQHPSRLRAEHHAGSLAAASALGRHHEVQRAAGAVPAPLDRRVHHGARLEARKGHTGDLRAAHPPLQGEQLLHARSQRIPGAGS